MSLKTYLIYPCGKRFELKIPIRITENGSTSVIFPGQDDYFRYAQLKFQINNLKVIEEEIVDAKPQGEINFISLSRRVRSIE